MVYLWSVGVVAAALPLALYRPVLFLALVAVFSFYAAFSGYRVTKLKALAKSGSAGAIDWIAGGITFCSSAALAGLAIFKPAAVQHMGTVAVVFGILGMRLAKPVDDVREEAEGEDVLVVFAPGNMIGSYIAAWTAFSVTKLAVYFGQSFLMWLWPTAMGVPAIVLTTIYYKRKFASKHRVVAV